MKTRSARFLVLVVGVILLAGCGPGATATPVPPATMPIPPVNTPVQPSPAQPSQPVVSSWATVDFIAARAGDLGFFTQPDYRHRGLGSIAAAAALEHGFANGLQQVNWTCDADNLASARTAERLGLERLEDYQQAVLIMDEKRHMAFFQQA